MIRLKFNDAGFRALRTSAAADSLLRDHAETVMNKANAVPSTTEPVATEPYYELVEAGDSDRARYRVKTTSSRAVRHEAKTQALLRSSD